MAERIVDENNLKLKTTKFFKSKKNKTITTYQDKSEIDLDSGESLHFIKAKTIDENLWGKVANFGNSAQFYLDINPNQLSNFINLIEAKLIEPSIISLPKTEIIKDSQKIAELDNKLIDKILDIINNNSGIDIDEFFISGVNFIFTDEYTYSLSIKGNRSIKTSLENLSIGSLIKFVDDNGIDLKQEMNNVYVHVNNEHGRSFSKPLKQFIDFVDDTDNYCLIDGKWYLFNQSYLDYLKNELDKIIPVYDDTFDISRAIVEDDFNRERINDGYVNLDKDLESFDGKKVEKCDLYKDNTLYFVKIGKPQKLNYVIDQAINTVKLLQHNKSKVKIDGSIVEIKKYAFG